MTDEPIDDAASVSNTVFTRVNTEDSTPTVREQARHPSLINAPTPPNLGQETVHDLEERVEDAQAKLAAVEENMNDHQPPISATTLKRAGLGVGATGLAGIGFVPQLGTLAGLVPNSWMIAGALGVLGSGIAGTAWLTQQFRDYRTRQTELEAQHAQQAEEVADLQAEFEDAQGDVEQAFQSLRDQIAPAPVIAVGSAAQILEHGPEGGWEDPHAGLVSLSQPVVALPSVNNPSDDIIAWSDPAPGRLVEINAGASWVQAAGYCREEAPRVRNALESLFEQIREEYGVEPEVLITLLSWDGDGTTAKRTYRYNIDQFAPTGVGQVFNILLGHKWPTPPFGATQDEPSPAEDEVEVDENAAFTYLNGRHQSAATPTQDKATPTRFDRLTSGTIGDEAEALLSPLTREGQVTLLVESCGDYDLIDPQLRALTKILATAAHDPGQSGTNEPRAVEIPEPGLMEPTPVVGFRTPGQLREKLVAGEVDTFNGVTIHPETLADEHGRMPEIWVLGIADPPTARQLPGMFGEVFEDVPEGAIHHSISTLGNITGGRLSILVSARSTTIDRLFPGALEDPRFHEALQTDAAPASTDPARPQIRASAETNHEGW